MLSGLGGGPLYELNHKGFSTEEEAQTTLLYGR